MRHDFFTKRAAVNGVRDLGHRTQKSRSNTGHPRVNAAARVDPAHVRFYEERYRLTALRPLVSVCKSSASLSRDARQCLCRLLALQSSYRMVAQGRKCG